MLIFLVLVVVVLVVLVLVVAAGIVSGTIVPILVVVAEALARFGARPDGAGDDDWAAEVAIAMRECGCDANGTVNFNSFKRVYNHTKGLAEKDSRGAPRSPMRRN